MFPVDRVGERVSDLDRKNSLGFKTRTRRSLGTSNDVIDNFTSVSVNCTSVNLLLSDTTSFHPINSSIAYAMSELKTSFRMHASFSVASARMTESY